MDKKRLIITLTYTDYIELEINNGNLNDICIMNVCMISYMKIEDFFMLSTLTVIIPGYGRAVVGKDTPSTPPHCFILSRSSAKG